MPVQARNGAAESQPIRRNSASYAGMISIHAISGRLPLRARRGAIEQFERGRAHLLRTQQAHAGMIGRTDAELTRPARNLLLQIDFLLEVSARPLDERRTVE